MGPGTAKNSPPEIQRVIASANWNLEMTPSEIIQKCELLTWYE